MTRLRARREIWHARVRISRRAGLIRGERPLGAAGGRAGGKVAKGGEVESRGFVAAEKGAEDGDAAADDTGAHFGAAVRCLLVKGS